MAKSKDKKPRKKRRPIPNAVTRGVGRPLGPNPRKVKDKSGKLVNPTIGKSKN